ncbi:MAG: molybdate ABC transporter substrate-binding protein [Chitinophagaceae bacterium]
MKYSTFIILLALVPLLYNCDLKRGKTTGVAAVQKNAITIAAASDLKVAMDSIIALFHTSHPSMPVSVIYGSSGKLFQQIIKQAPFDLYFSADIDYAKKLAQLGLTDSEPRIYAVGRIVIWSNKISTQKGISSLLDEMVNKIAIANPAHAPYGKRAEEALLFYGIHDQVRSKLVLGENISQTAQYVSSGAAEIGIIALSLALSPALRQQGNYFLIPDTAHRKLEQAYVILKRAAENRSADLFSDFITSKQAKDILKKNGFTFPE